MPFEIDLQKLIIKDKPLGVFYRIHEEWMVASVLEAWHLLVLCPHFMLWLQMYFFPFPPSIPCTGIFSKIIEISSLI